MSHKDVEFARDRFFSIASEFYAGHLTLPKLCRLRVLRLQQGAYRFLEKPTGFLAKFYHSAVFCLILAVYILSAIVEYSNSTQLWIFNFLELFVVLYLLLEFLLRLWAVGADAHFHGLRGRFAYLRRPICLIDMVVLVASFALLFWPNGNDHPNASAIVHPSPSSPPVGFLRIGQFLPVANSIAIDKFRFFQILRLLHVDRQMSAFSLIHRMIRRSRSELLSAYYITFMIFLALAVCVFHTEEWMEAKVEEEEKKNADIIDEQQQFNTTNSKNGKTFRTFGHSFWFSIVTVLTIGYGDIVPRGLLSKCVVCIFSYLGLSMFSAANGLVGVGMSLMLSDEKQQKKQGKIRDLAARLIQSWIRFHFIMDNSREGGCRSQIRIYRKFCARLKRAEERIMKAREMVKMAAEKKADRKFPQLGGRTNSGGTQFVRILQKISPSMEKRQPPMAQIKQQLEEEFVEEYSDEERILDFFYNNRSHSNSLLSNRSEEEERAMAMATMAEEGEGSAIGGGKMDELRRYGCILRMCYFLVFISLRKNFKRARSPYELVDAEAELCEMEHQRMQKFRELEMRLDSQLGTTKWKRRMRREEDEEEEEEEDGTLMAKGIGERMEQCERKIAEMANKAELMEQMASLIFKTITTNPSGTATIIRLDEERKEEK